MHQFEHGSEQLYDEAQQQRIIEIAAQLQRQERQLASRRQLEEIAAEAGIEARFVRAAAEIVDGDFGSAHDARISVRLFTVAVAAMALLNFVGLATSAMSPHPHMFLVCAPIILSVVAGALARRQLRERLFVLSTGLVSSVFATIGVYTLPGYVFGEALRLHMAAQLIAVLLGFGVSWMVAKVRTTSAYQLTDLS